MASLVAVGECYYFDHNKELWVIGTVHVRVSDPAPSGARIWYSDDLALKR